MVANDILKELILSNEKFILENVRETVKRDAERFPDVLRKVFVLYGVRRSGKTYILFDIFKKYQDCALYLDFEDERLSEFDCNDFEKIKNVFFELKPDCLNKRTVFLFDEVQNVKGWEKFCRRAVERENISVYVSGSSSRMMPFEIGTELRGRAWSAEILPFSFKESLRAKNIDGSGLIHGRQKNILKIHFREYMKWGGFPEMAKIESAYEKTRLIKEYLSAMYFRDLVEKYNISNIHLFDALNDRLFSAFALKYSLTSFHKQYMDKFPFSKDLLFRYYKYFIQSMLIFEVKKFSESSYKRMRNPSKIYLIDTSLCRKVSSSDDGRLLENVVFLELKRRHCELFYFDEGVECDFIAKTQTDELVPLQVCLELNRENVDREVAGLVKACKWLKKKNGLLITFDDEKELARDGVKIAAIPAWKFMLEKDDSLGQ